MDLAINGGGFFRMNSGGSISYSRNGQFTIDKSGYIVNTSGARLTGYPQRPRRNHHLDPGRPATVAGRHFPQVDQHFASGVQPGRNLSHVERRGVQHGEHRDLQQLHVAVHLRQPGQCAHASMYMVKTAANTWDVFAAQDGTQIGPAIAAEESDRWAPLTSIPGRHSTTGATTLPFAISAPWRAAPPRRRPLTWIHRSTQFAAPLA